MTIGATEHDVLCGLVHGLDPLMALQAARTLGICLRLALIDPIARRNRAARSDGLVNRNGRGRAVTIAGRAADGSTKSQSPNSKETPNPNHQTAASRGA